MDAQHAPLAPSFAPVWAFCSGAPHAAAALPNPETEDTRNGEAGHWVFSETALNIRDDRDGPRDCFGYTGRTAPNGVVIDDEMAEGAQAMVDEIIAVAVSYGLLKDLMIEERVFMPRIHPTNNWGRLDAALIVPGKNGRPYKIYIWDYKSGRRVKIARGNKQLIDYFEGIAERVQLRGDEDTQVLVSLRVVQPFAFANGGPVNTWDGYASDLRADINKLYSQAQEVYTNPSLTPGAHCRDCPANGKCSAAKKYLYILDDLTRLPYSMDDMSPAELATEREILLDALAAGKGRLDAIEAQLKEHLRAGATGTGLTLETTYGRRKWACDPLVAATIARQFGADIAKPAVDTPRQSEAKVSADFRKAFKTAISSPGITETPIAGIKLVNLADSKTAKAFKRK